MANGYSVERELTRKFVEKKIVKNVYRQKNVKTNFMEKKIIKSQKVMKKKFIKEIRWKKFRKKKNSARLKRTETATTITLL